MPKAAVKQKTRQKAKTTTRSPFEPGRPVHDDSDVEMDADANGDDSDEAPEKDEVEEKLERMLFGDDEGFHEALKNRSLATLAVGSDDEGSVGGSGEDGEDGGLEGVDDADVRIPFTRGERDIRLTWVCDSFSSSIPALRLCPPISQTQPLPYPTEKTMAHWPSRRCGTTATTSV